MAGLAEYKRTILAGKTTAIGARGTVVILRTASIPMLVTARSQKPGQDGQAYSLILRPGEKWFCAEEFTQVEVQNPSVDDHVAVLLIGYGDFVGPIPASNADGLVGSVVFFAAAAVPIDTVLLPANPLRWRAHIQNRNFPSTSSGGGPLTAPPRIYIDGPHNVITWNGGGTTVEPAQTFTIETRDEIRVMIPNLFPGADDIHIGISEEYFRQ